MALGGGRAEFVSVPSDDERRPTGTSLWLPLPLFPGFLSLSGGPGEISQHSSGTERRRQGILIKEPDGDLSLGQKPNLDLSYFHFMGNGFTGDFKVFFL